MSTKTISITEEAYRRLASLRERENESFSEVIKRVTGKTKLRDFFGILSKDATDELEETIIESRSKHRKARQIRLKRIERELEV
ncbi:antitoxin VapB family protein [Candidatus Pacearchaeota archaeon]|nr:antitoxin VapB family protein [Candidatus Pacearchaeota archaeon]